jgi:hypothetical protein
LVFSYGVGVAQVSQNLRESRAMVSPLSQSHDDNDVAYQAGGPPTSKPSAFTFHIAGGNTAEGFKAVNGGKHESATLCRRVKVGGAVAKCIGIRIAGSNKTRVRILNAAANREGASGFSWLLNQ